MAFRQFSTGCLNQPSAFAMSAERCCSGHTWYVTVRSCPSGAEGSALVASCSLYPVQDCAFDVYGTRQSLSHVSE